MIITGFVSLIFGANWLVDCASSLAIKSNISDLVIGLTIVAFGTPAPELVVNAVASFNGLSDIVFANIIGSNNFNLFSILGIAIGNVIGSIIFNIMLIISMSSFVNPIKYNPDFNQDLLMLIGGTIFLLVAMFTGKRKMLDRWEAFVLISFYLIYTIYCVSKEL